MLLCAYLKIYMKGSEKGVILKCENQLSQYFYLNSLYGGFMNQVSKNLY